ncbi:MAG: Deoxycytidine monophosphate (dCMP) deaminase [Icmadophila ericetorum]|nr:Deoxycytidine monophosphate (dCMP) deaminase [Icmadophila ericetorum]
MLIGLCGGICAGKHAVARYLIEKHNFSTLNLAPSINAPVPSLDQSTRQKYNYKRAKSQDELHKAKDKSFSTVDELLEFVTKEWYKYWVLTDIWDEKVLDALARRPFFLLISVDAPVMLRWERFRISCEEAPPSLEQFVLWDDYYLFDSLSGLAKLIDRATVRLVNSSTSLSAFHDAIDELDLTSEQRLRPSWDQYFMQLASLAAQRSNCMKRRVGCVLIREKRVISTGYNGTPRNLRNCNEGGCPRCNGGQGAGQGLSTCLCIHAEENALLEAGRERIREGSILYCDTYDSSFFGSVRV